ncbi:MAG TPA: peptide chain release factor N(5)-glutamine methyltransferase [Dokdonella sp.]|uniref:peptide chain release factor N(5)-glutamine methyltransferase n=1 Tax=Dokdonella sp. TaxID=2291710 RepID=UPI002D803FDF|nr:peptide chain release factor N(5)-glutamine methyltransferase [Dokdonella sp.]HET9031802.1 peptide chain release factor N(5)-glutamine methyltransferase [Dokdonella sp.]
MMASISEILAAASRPGDVEWRHEAEILLGHVLQRDRAWLFTHADFVPDSEQAKRFQDLLEARLRGEPVAYLIGRRGFWTLDLEVTPDVLIPRPETELLVELALERIPLDGEFRVADLGTGSGAIALAIASERPRARILATDASASALAVARANAERLGISNVEFAEGNWCEALGSRRFDLIVSNPPYIAADDVHLGQGDLRHEPASALASGADGLDAIRSIVDAAPRHLVNQGWLLLEHGYEQGQAVRSLLQQYGLEKVQTWSDVSGHDRTSGGRILQEPDQG